MFASHGKCANPAGFQEPKARHRPSSLESSVQEISGIARGPRYDHYVAFSRVWSALLALLALGACNPEKSAQPNRDVSFENQTPGNFLAHGERLTFVLGCQGCHGKGMTGNKWDDDPAGYGIMWASNLTQAIPSMNDQQLEALLRRGVHPVRGDLWVMPSQMFQHLSAPDMKALITYLRTLPTAGTLSPPPAPGPKARAEIAAGRYKPAAAMVIELRDVLPVDAGSQVSRGRYITSVTCVECHGPKLEGGAGEEGTIPDLIVAGTYTPGEFERFITTGVTPGNRKIHPLMVQVAKSRFSHLAPNERQALYGYLHARAILPK